MKQNVVPMGLVVLGFAVAGCQETFSPKIPFTETPVVFCIIRARYDRLPSQQEVVVSHTYDVGGVDPSAPHQPPVVTGAQVTLRVNSRIYTFDEVLGPRPDSSKLARPGRYSHPSVTLYPFDSLSLTVVLPDGRRLTARTFVPSLVGLDTRPVYAHGFTTRVNRFTEGDAFVLDWDNAIQEDHLFFPKLTLLYSTQLGTVSSGGSVEVPLQYVSRGGSQIPVYPDYQTGKTCSYPFDVIDETLRQIGAGTPEGTVVTVRNIVFYLTEFDFSLSHYYASVNGYLDQYSVRTEESVYSNINGGIGLLGARMESAYSFQMDKRYVESFGYQYAGPE